MTHTPFADMAGTTSRAWKPRWCKRVTGTWLTAPSSSSSSKDRPRPDRAGKQKRPAKAALPSMSGRAGPKQGAKTRRKWLLRKVPAETCSGYATHLSLGGHVVLLAPDTVLYLDAEPTLGSRQSSEQGAEQSPAQANSLCSSPLALLVHSSHFPATRFLWFHDAF